MNKFRRKSFTYAINFSVLVFGLQMTMTGPLLDKMSATFGSSVADTGSLFSFSAAGFAIAIILAGILSDRIGKKKIIVWSSFGFAAALLLFSWSSWFPLSMALYFAVGGFGGIMESSLSALVADINPGREGRAVTFTHVFFGIGAVIGPASAGWLAGSDLAWQLAFAASGVLALVSALWISRYQYPPVKAEDRLELAAFASILSNRNFLLLCAAVAIYVGAEISVWGWTPQYLKTELNYSSAAAGGMVSILWVAMSIGRMISSALASKFPNRILVSGLCLTAMLGLIAQFFAPPQPLTTLFFVLIGLGFSGIWPLVVSQAGMLFASKHTGTSFGLAVAAGGIGGMVIPYLFGKLGEHLSMGWLIGMLSILMVLIMIIYAIISGSETNHSRQPMSEIG